MELACLSLSGCRSVCSAQPLYVCVFRVDSPPGSASARGHHRAEYAHSGQQVQL